MLEKQALVIREEGQLQVAPIQVANVFGLKIQTVNSLVSQHGVEAVNHALEVKEDKLTIDLTYFLKICEKTGLPPAVVANFYRARQEVFGEYKGVPSQDTTIVGMSKLAQHFQDFREEDLDEQIDQLSRIVKMFQRVTFKKAVATILKRAEDLGIESFENLVNVMEDYSSGELHRTFFPDEDLEEMVWEEKEEWD